MVRLQLLGNHPNCLVIPINIYFFLSFLRGGDEQQVPSVEVKP
jgi:hypothetical protein